MIVDIGVLRLIYEALLQSIPRIGVTGFLGRNCGINIPTIFPHGRKHPPLIQFSQGETGVDAIAVELVDTDEALRQLNYNLLREISQRYPKLLTLKFQPQSRTTL